MSSAHKPVACKPLSPAEREKFQQELNKIQRGGNRADYARAKWAEALEARMGLQVKKVMFEDFGLVKKTIASFMQRLDALHYFPDEAVWIAVGWKRLQQVLQLSQSARETCLAELADVTVDGCIPEQTTVSIVKHHLDSDSAVPTRRPKDSTRRALSVLKYLLEHYAFPGYKIPQEVIEACEAKIDPAVTRMPAKRRGKKKRGRRAA